MKFFFIDKPLEITSFDVIRILRKELDTSKMWHTGTLDPLATGGLLIAVWKYTKLIPYLEKDTKEYVFSFNLDWVSESYDLWTPVSYISEEEKEKAKNSITKKDIEDILKQKFTGQIFQIPPKYSAIKLWWKKALELVKSWVDFEMKKREATVYEIELLDFNYPEVSIRAKVSAGTYIRTIAFDLWEILQTWAYVTKLRRTKIWEIDISQSQKLENFDEKKELDIKYLFKNKNFINLEKEILSQIDNWLKVYWDFDFPIDEDLFVYNENKNIVTNIVKYNWKFLKAVRKI